MLSTDHEQKKAPAKKTSGAARSDRIITAVRWAFRFTPGSPKLRRVVNQLGAGCCAALCSFITMVMEVCLNSPDQG